MKQTNVKPASGKLGILVVGCGAVSTTFMTGVLLARKGLWKKPGVYNVEEFDPDPFMEQLNKQGLPWHEIHDGDLEL